MFFPVLLFFFEVDLIILLTQLFACFWVIILGLFSSLEALFTFLLAWALLNFLESFFIALSPLNIMFLLDKWSFGIYTPSNVGFSSKSKSNVIDLEVMSLKILRSLTQMTLFWSLI